MLEKQSQEEGLTQSGAPPSQGRQIATVSREPHSGEGEPSMPSEIWEKEMCLLLPFSTAVFRDKVGRETEQMPQTDRQSSTHKGLGDVQERLEKELSRVGMSSQAERGWGGWGASNWMQVRARGVKDGVGREEAMQKEGKGRAPG